MPSQGCPSFTLHAPRGYTEIRGFFSIAAPRAQDQPRSFRYRWLKYSSKPKHCQWHLLRHALPAPSLLPPSPQPSPLLALRRSPSRAPRGWREQRLRSERYRSTRESGAGARAGERQGLGGRRGAGRCCAWQGQHRSPARAPRGPRSTGQERDLFSWTGAQESSTAST